MIELYTVYGKADGPRGLYQNWDLNQDGKITVNEVRKGHTFSSKFKIENDHFCSCQFKADITHEKLRMQVCYVLN